MAEVLDIKKTRFSCLTKEQQNIFNSWNLKQRKYAVFRSQGYDKANSYRMAGYNCSKQAGQNGYKLEHQGCPRMTEIIEAMSGQRRRFDTLIEGTEISKKIDKKADEELKPEDIAFLTTVPEDALLVENEPLEVDRLSPEQCRNIQFFRSIANGSIKNITVTRTYDAQGKLTGKKVVEESNVETRIKAQKEVMRMVGLNDVIELGKVEANNINIMIVDASKREELNDSRNKVDIPLDNVKEIDGEIAIVKEVEEKS